MEQSRTAPAGHESPHMNCHTETVEKFHQIIQFPFNIKRVIIYVRLQIYIYIIYVPSFICKLEIF